EIAVHQTSRPLIVLSRNRSVWQVPAALQYDPRPRGLQYVRGTRGGGCQWRLRVWMTRERAWA
ncbi:MAG: hypothetical protein WA384_15465, partial [Rhodomicrobium sp.]